MTTKTDYFFLFRSPKVEQILIKKHGIYGAFDVAAIFRHYKRFFVQLCLGVVPIWKTEKRVHYHYFNIFAIETFTGVKCLRKSLMLGHKFFS